MRKRRRRSETRLTLLEAAARVAIARIGQGGHEANPLASVRITDALAEVNSDGLDPEGEPLPDYQPMTTGAAYHIWPDQAAFQVELLEHVMNKISTPGAEEIEGRAREMIASGASPDEIFRMVSDAGFEASSTSPEVFLAVGLGAMAPPMLVREAQSVANARYVATVERLFTAILNYAGWRLRPGNSMTDLIWATEALAWGYLLRWRTHPEISTATDDHGWSARSTAYLGLIHAFTEPTSDP